MRGITIRFTFEISNRNDMENIKQLAKSNWPSMVIALPAFAATVYAIVTEIINRF